MNYKNILKNILVLTISLLTYLLIISVFSRLNLLSYKIINTISFIFIILLFNIMSIKISRVSKYKGIISGLIIGSINIIYLFLLSIIFKTNNTITILIYYLILLISSIIGGTIGSNTRKK